MISYFWTSSSTYYYYLKRVNKTEVDSEIKQEIISIYEKHKGRYGYRRITIELQKRLKINYKKVKRIMNELGLKGIQPREKYKSFKGELNKKIPNHLLEEKEEKGYKTGKLGQNFKTSKPNQKWTTDVTEFKVKDKKTYLSPIRDMHTGYIIVRKLSKSPNFKMVEDMLDEALAKFDNLEGLIFHSDQGWPYQMPQYQKKLKDRGIIQSMSRKGNCLDNSIMETFFAQLKNEIYYGKEYKSIDELEQKINEYIDYYNNERIILRLKMSPAEYWKRCNMDQYKEMN
ncbi:transposase, IS861 [Mycoplasmopsis caviae]|uniref:Transposase, IS861 n=1 Tax=Mycoplasmopsis caviae TaxID=55603 RepID=A0A3P8MF72_9BACT|nr:transposase, IS861 [Mycoplasmopsis caviae]